MHFNRFGLRLPRPFGKPETVRAAGVGQGGRLRIGLDLGTNPAPAHHLAVASIRQIRLTPWRDDELR